MRLLLLAGVIAGCDFSVASAVDADVVLDGPADGSDGVDAMTDAVFEVPDAPDVGQVEVSPAAVTHGLVAVGDQKGARIMVQNSSATGSAPLGIDLAGTGFTMSTTCGTSLPPAGTCNIEIEITPQDLISYSANLTVTSSGVAHVVPLSATGAWALTVTRDGLGEGTITSVPAGLACRDTCTALFPGDVQLEAVPDPGSVGGSWSLAGCSGRWCEVPASRDGRAITAAFQRGREITVTREGSGTIASNPLGIDCGATCSGVFVGTLTLTATPFVGQTFLGWSELTCGTNPTCVIPDGLANVQITGRFSEGATTSLDLELAGDAEGEMLVLHDATVVGRCTSSCSLAVPTGALTIAAVTPYRLESLTGTDCVQDHDRCEITPPGHAQITATFRRDPKDLWTFFGHAGEEFTDGGFDAAGNLIARSQDRVIKLGPNGALLWERPWIGGEVLVAPSGIIYVADLRGAVQLGPAGDERWIRPGAPRALDAAQNVLVADYATGSARMTLYRPDGTVIWTAPGDGTEIDGSGTIYEPFTELEWNDTDDHPHRVLYMHRYDAVGMPLADTGPSGSVEEWGDFQVVMTANRHAVLERDEWDYSILRMSVYNPSTKQRTHLVEAWRLDAGVPRGFITGAGDDIGFVHDPDELEVWSFASFGYQLDRLRADGTTWTVMRFPWISSDQAPYYGARHAGIAGGAGGHLAMLGSYQPFRDWGEPLALVGFIQAFAP